MRLNVINSSRGAVLFLLLLFGGSGTVFATCTLTGLYNGWAELYTCDTEGEALAAASAALPICQQSIPSAITYAVQNGYANAGNNGYSRCNPYSWSYLNGCPTDSGYSWYGTADACGDDYCMYSADTTNCIGEFCLNDGHGTGSACNTPGDMHSPDGCTMEGSTVVCDCSATPDAWYCPGGGGADNPNCTTIGTETTCYDSGDPENPNNWPDDESPPPPDDSPNLPGPSPNVPDGDDQTTSTNKDDTDIGNGIIDAINNVTAAVNVNTTATVDTTDAVNLASYKITSAIKGIDLNNTAVVDAINAQIAADAAIAEARRLADIANNLDTTNAIDAMSMQNQADNEAIKAQIIAEGLQANADAAAIAAKAGEVKDSVDLAAVAAAAASAANTDAINAAATVAHADAQAVYNAVIDQAVQAALDAAELANKQGETTQAVLDQIQATVDQAAEEDANFTDLLAAQNATTQAIIDAKTDIVTEIGKACNPLSDAECEYTGSAAASEDCGTPPTCNGDPVKCEELKQQWMTMCHVKAGITEQSESYTGLLTEIRDRLPDDNNPYMDEAAIDAVIQVFTDKEDDIKDPSWYSPSGDQTTWLDDTKAAIGDYFNTKTNSIFVTAACPDFTIDMQEAGFSYTFPFSETVGKYTRAIMAVFIWVWAFYTSYWLYVKWSMKV